MNHLQWCGEQVLSASWFDGGDEPARAIAVSALPWWTDPAVHRVGVRSEVVEVQFPGRIAHYQLLVAYGPGQTEPRDALRDPADRMALWQGLRGDRDPATTLHLRTVEPLPDVPDSAVVEGEQSNTSIRYGEVSLLKLFRRLWHGHNPDVEVHDRFTRRRSTRTARLQAVGRGTWWPSTAGPHDPPLRADLAMVVQQFAGATDAWTRAAADPSSVDLRSLGSAVGEVHTMLAQIHGVQQIPGSQVETWLIDRVRRHATEATELEPVLEPIVAQLRVSAPTVPVTHVHGDAHLGQALMTPEREWKLIDFEQEPTAPISRRSEPTSPLRDVAGFLRSLSYVAWMRGHTDTERAWLDQARHEFMAGWEATSPVPLDRALVRAHEIERAAYEVTYERSHRTEWLHIPLTDLGTLAHLDTRADLRETP